jgi:hypothetical protein
MDDIAFYDTLEMMDIEDCVDFLKCNYYNIAMDANPDAILRRFYSTTDPCVAEALANIFLEFIGPIVVCRESSLDAGRFITIMDTLVMSDEWDYHPGKLLLLEAFDKHEFKFEYECDHRLLIMLYGLDDQYMITLDCIDLCYNYKNIKNEQSWLAEGIQSYFFHPERIQKWIAIGGSLEDYMV